MAPELVVAGHPEHLREPFRGGTHTELEMLQGLAHVTGQDQPVLEVGAPRGKRLAVRAVAEMQVAQRVELHAAPARQSHRKAGVAIQLLLPRTDTHPRRGDSREAGTARTTIPRGI